MRSLVLVVTSLVMLVSFVSPTLPVEADTAVTPTSDAAVLYDQEGNQVPTDLMAYYSDIRSTFGLSSSAEEIQKVLSEYGEIPEWGFPMTPAELKKVEGHQQIQIEFPEEAIMGFHELPGYAGFFFDHKNGGAPTLMVTDPGDVETAARSSLPTTLADELVVVGAAFTWEQLEKAALAVAEGVEKDRGTKVHRIAIKTIDNRLEISVSDQSDAGLVSVDLAKVVDVPFSVVVEPVSEPEACARSACATGEWKAGIEVWGNGSGSTLGFAIMHGTDEQYLVAGHHWATMYTHNGTNIGSTAESEYRDNGIDARAVYAADARVNDDVYVTSSFTRDIIGMSYPTVGHTVYLSGMKSGVRGGTVQDNYLIYSTSAVLNLRGASANYYSQSGDSGGPIYRIASGTAKAYAVGIHSTGAGDKEFARCYDLNYYMGATVLS